MRLKTTLSRLLLPFVAAACQIIEAGDKIADEVDKRERADDITITQDVPPIAVRARYVIEAEYVVEGNHVPTIERAALTGPFEVVRMGRDIDLIEANRTEIRALGLGRGSLEVTSDEDESASVSFEAAEAVRVLITAPCWSGMGRSIVPIGTAFSIAYQLFSASDLDLAGALEPPLLDNPLTYIASSEGRASYTAPETPGVFEIASALTTTSLFRLTVVDRSQLKLEIYEGEIRGARRFPHSVAYEVRQTLAGEKLCAQAATRYTWSTETPAVCAFALGRTVSMDGATTRIDALGPGTCRLRAHADELSVPDAVFERVWDTI